MSETTNTQVPVPTTDTKVDETAKNEEKQVEKTFNQEQLNEIVAKRANEIQKKLNEENQAAIEKAVAEERRLSKLSQEEKEKELIAKQSELNKAKEKDLTLRENRIIASEQLTQSGLSTKLVDFLVSEDKDQMLDRIEKFKSVYDEAVQEGIKKGLAGTTQKDVNTTTELQDQGIVSKRHF